MNSVRNFGAAAYADRDSKHLAVAAALKCITERQAAKICALRYWTRRGLVVNV
jgi:hypothetical protein